jgi:hypothetical protein
MTKKDFLKLQRALEPELPQFISRGDIMYLPPVDSLLRGIHFDPSGFSKTAFYISAFVMPLCVPTSSIVLSYGKRLRINGTLDAWDSNRPKLQQELLQAIHEEGFPFLETIQTLNDFVEYVKTVGTNIRDLEALGYTLARNGNTNEALKVFAQITEIIPANQWESDLQTEVLALTTLLKRDPSEAQQVLTQNEMKAREILRLPEPLQTTLTR